MHIGLSVATLWSRCSMDAGQVRPASKMVIEGAGWFDGTGSWIASGDLASNDFENLSRKLEDGEVFFALNSVFGHPARCVEKIGYVFEHARFMVCKDGLYCLEPHTRRTLEMCGITFQVISREGAWEIFCTKSVKVH